MPNMLGVVHLLRSIFRGEGGGVNVINELALYFNTIFHFLEKLPSINKIFPKHIMTIHAESKKKKIISRMFQSSANS
jgi:hypothetical protein